MMNTRTLKIESAGDFWRGTVSPKIRLSGHWLERAGFKPGNRVLVQASEPGILTLRFLELDHANEK
jgi:type I toxin-antitoxin system toxin SymE